MTPDPYRALSALLIGPLLLACSTNVEVPESTTVAIPPEGATITSADGLFSLRLDPGETSTQISIETLRGVDVAGLASLIYEVHVPDPQMRASEVFYDAQKVDAPYTKVLVTVDDGAPQMLSTHWDLKNQRLLSNGIDLERRRFAVLELGFRHGDCSNRSCNESCTYCEPGRAACVPREGQCDLAGSCQVDGVAACNGAVDGWDEAPGDGVVFVIDSMEIAEEDRGFDVDGACTQSGCVDNQLWSLGALVNDPLRQSLLGGEKLRLIELAGLGQPFNGDDPSLTIKTYAARDADDPAFPANDFRTPPGATDCCTFEIEPWSVTGAPPQARHRAPARIERARLRTLAPTPFDFGELVGGSEAPRPTLRLERTLMSGRVDSNLSQITEGLMGGAVPIGELAGHPNPFCQTVSPRCPVAFGATSTLLDLVTQLVGPQPDVDLDGDGLECLLDTDGDGRIDRCCDGEADACGNCARVVPPTDSSDPSSCALNPAMADGHSIGVNFTAVRAQLGPAD